MTDITITDWYLLRHAIVAGAPDGIQASADLVSDAIDSFSKGMEMAPDDWKPFFQSKLDRLTSDQD